uniref:Uncharacterized protein n=1 Tax=Caenorhabditis japonica TaxID=281687 RepID=A0A8R1E6U5_CAEJA
MLCQYPVHVSVAGLKFYNTEITVLITLTIGYCGLTLTMSSAHANIAQYAYFKAITYTCDTSIRTIDDEMIRATSSKNFVII